MLNKVILAGRAGKDSEIKTSKSGKEFTSFSLATNSGYKDASGQWKETTDWHNVICWWKVNISKGDIVYVTAELSYYDSKTGKTPLLTAKEVKVLSSRTQEAEQKNNFERTSSQDMFQDDDDLPF